jgi:TRAP-type C4-dicarboxylate transport system permease small subunit
MTVIDHGVVIFSNCGRQGRCEETQMGKVVDAFFQVLKAAIVLCLVGMVILVFGNVVLRYGFNSGITVSEELSRLFFVYLTFLGAIVAMHEHLHLGVDTLVKRLSYGGKKFCLIASQLLMLYATWIFLVGSWEQTMINMDTKAPASGLSMAFLYGVGIIFSVSAGLILLHDLYRVVAGKISEEEMVMVKESEEAAELEDLQRQLEEKARHERGLPTATKVS